MKIDIITLSAVKNYGSVLQALATQELFSSHGFEVQIINYSRRGFGNDKLINSWAKGNVLKKVAIYPTIKRWNTVFDKFCNEHLNFTSKKYATDEDFSEYPCEADIYCTGSDQVWNSVWNKGIIGPLYLNFVPDKKYRIAFAASFGQDAISEEEIKNTENYIHKYNKISVREDSAVKILTEQYGYEGAIQLVDPTLGFPADYWRKFKASVLLDKDYILIYNLNRNQDFDRYAKKLSQKTGLPLVRICWRYDQFYRVGKSVLVPDIPTFIALIDNAKYVLTDSFHATAFAMNMGTEPICVSPPSFSGRIDSFLRCVNSIQKKVLDYEDFEVVDRAVNFNEVDMILKKEREKIHSFIEAVNQDSRRYYGFFL